MKKVTLLLRPSATYAINKIYNRFIEILDLLSFKQFKKKNKISRTQSIRFKTGLLILICLTTIGNMAFAQSSSGGIQGTILDENSTPVPFASIGAYSGDFLKGQARSDINGHFKIKPLNPGAYTLKFNSARHAYLVVDEIMVRANKTTNEIITLYSKGSKVLGKHIVRTRKIIDPNNPNEPTLTGKEVKNLPMNDIESAIKLIPGVDNGGKSGGDISIGGERSGGTLVMVDGVMTSTATLKNLSPDLLREITVFKSGVPVEIGNTTGGVIAVSTMGISSKLKGSVRAQHSLDGFNNNSLNLSLSGPLLFKKDSNRKKGRPILGFLLGLSGKYNKDPNPSYIGYTTLKPDVLNAIQESPLSTNPNGTGNASFVPSAETVTSNDFRVQKARENGENQNFNYLGKLDFAPTSKINISLGTYFDYNKDRNWNFLNSLFAPEANSINERYEARGSLRLQQSLGRDDEKENAIISNAFYSVQLSYQRRFNKSENPNHGQDAFRYGYVGKFDQTTQPIYRQDTVTGLNGNTYYGWRFIGDGLTDLTYTAQGINPLLENYTKQVMTDARFSIDNQTALQSFGGLRNGDGPNSAYGLWAGPGSQISSFNYSQSDQFDLNLSGSFDINQGIKNKSNKNPITHQIKFGMGYQQTTSRSYALGASGLWTLMRLQTNRHIQNLDTDHPIFVVGGNEYTEQELLQSGLSISEFDTIRFNRFNALSDQTRFDKELREKILGNQQSTDLIYTDNLDPSVFSLDMFEADDLYNQGSSYVNYAGYDYLGNTQRRSPNFKDFWTKKDERGDYARPIAPYNPNYMFGYISDLFSFKDITFNIGVRIDRFDANQSVLRDPYSLYGVRDIGSLDAGSYSLARNPETNTIAPDPKDAGFDGTWVPYVDNNQTAQPTLVGYRKDDTWYDPFGKEISDPTVLSEAYANGLPIQPWLTDPTDSIKSAGYKVENAFEDYKPDISISPRIQFTFPISDQALFYGNYDIRTQNPQGRNFATPDDYYYMAERSTTLNNANLQMQRLINYTLGFEQALTTKSKVGIEVYYNERKDQIQQQQYLLAYPQTYTSYSNRDFSSTKGFIFSYKLLPSKKIPLRMSLAYTLQFAEGSGSSSTSMSSLIAQGQPNLRIVAPNSFDTRHNGTFNIDYRFARDYAKGPTIGRDNPHHLLNGLGANLLFSARSGRPYTKTAVAVPIAGGGSNVPIIGGLNGSRRPWTTDLGLRINKNLVLRTLANKKNSKKGQIKKSSNQLYVDVYVYFENLLNSRNVIGLYSYSGLPNDDGYLASPQGQQDINTSRIYPESYTDLYTTRMNNPFNYNNPRRIYLGCSVNF